MDEFEVGLPEREEGVPGDEGDRVDYSKEEEEGGVVLDEGDLGGDEIDSGDVDDADHNCCRSCDPETGVEDLAVIMGGHEPDDGKVETEIRKNHYETKGGDESGSDPDLSDGIQPCCKCPE